MEYVSQVFNDSLPIYLKEDLEKLQKRAGPMQVKLSNYRLQWQYCRCQGEAFRGGQKGNFKVNKYHRECSSIACCNFIN